MAEIGVKFDSGKSPVVQGCFNYFGRALEAVSVVSLYGAKKYNDGKFPTTWRNVPDGLERYTDADGRHLLLEGQGQIYDDESGLLHAAHHAWNALARLEFILDKYNVDRKDNVNDPSI